MRALVEQLDRIPEVVILAFNAALGGFVLLAHGGALLLLMSEEVPAPPGYDDMVRSVVPVSLPTAGLVVLGSGLGVAWTRTRPIVLTLQAVALSLSAVALLGWAVSLVIHGIPAGNFAWTPGFLTAWVLYSSLLFRRFALSAWRQHRAASYIPLVAALLAFPIDAGVFVRFVAMVSRR